MKQFLFFSIILIFISCKEENRIPLEKVKFQEEKVEDVHKENGIVVYLSKAKKNYYEDEPLQIHMIIKNIADSLKYVPLKEFDSHYGELPYPTSLEVYISDEEGNEICQYSSQYTMVSLLLTKEEKDSIPLEPGEEIRRSYDVSRIVAGCSLPLVGGIEEGTYNVQVGIDGTYYSNKITIKVVQPEEQAV